MEQWCGPGAPGAGPAVPPQRARERDARGVEGAVRRLHRPKTPRRRLPGPRRDVRGRRGAEHLTASPGRRHSGDSLCLRTPPQPDRFSVCWLLIHGHECSDGNFCSVPTHGGPGAGTGLARVEFSSLELDL